MHPLPTLLLLLTPQTIITLALAQTSTVIVLPTPVTWQDALAACQQLGHAIYPVPATPTDPVYEVLEAQPGPADRYWIARRRGGSCTCLSMGGAGVLVEEMPCGDLMPAFCQG
jgi:hypothetical protein